MLFTAFLANVPVFSQNKKKESGRLLFSLGMGINYSASPSFTDYFKNELPAGTHDSIKTYSTGVEFFGGLEYGLSKTLSAKIDYSYYVRSNLYRFIYYIFDYTVTAHQPYIMLYFNNTNSKFRFKLGAGAGYHFYSLKNNVSASNQLYYTAGGFSFRGEFIFNPKFSKILETYLSGYVFGSTTSNLKDASGNTLKGTATGKEVNLGGYGVGARLGLSFYLN